MFCFQCEQTAQGKGCDHVSSCGKDERTAATQDVLVHALKGVSQYAHRARQLGAVDAKIDAFVTDSLFATLTNVNFDAERLAKLVVETATVRDHARRLYENACREKNLPVESVTGPAQFQPASNVDGIVAQGPGMLITERQLASGKEVANLQELVIYGLKGTVAYTEHARQLGHTDPAVFAVIHEVLDFLTLPSPTLEQLLGYALKVGELNLKVMELLDKANTGTFGDPVPTAVRIHPRKGKAILISGHDLADLGALLEQTKGTGINVYTHGEMLPGHGYPKLKAHPHLAGNYGGAWQDQAKEFDEFPGAILMTTNCIQKPKDSYKDVSLPAAPPVGRASAHVSRKDFSAGDRRRPGSPGLRRRRPGRHHSGRLRTQCRAERSAAW